MELSVRSAGWQSWKCTCRDGTCVATIWASTRLSSDEGFGVFSNTPRRSTGRWSSHGDWGQNSCLLEEIGRTQPVFIWRATGAGTAPIRPDTSDTPPQLRVEPEAAQHLLDGP